MRNAPANAACDTHLPSVPHDRLHAALRVQIPQLHKRVLAARRETIPQLPSPIPFQKYHVRDAVTVPSQSVEPRLGHGVPHHDVRVCRAAGEKGARGVVSTGSYGRAVAVKGDRGGTGVKGEEQDQTRGVAGGHGFSVGGKEEVCHLSLAGGLAVRAEQSHLRM